MRIRHSLKAFVPFILMLAAGRSVQAQYGPPVPQQPMPQGPYNYPGGFQQYPTESPYQSLFNQTYVSDGTWYKDSNNGFGPFSRPREWSFGIEYTRTRARKMRGIVGEEGVQTYFQQNDPASNGIVEGLEYFNYFDAASASMIPQLDNNGMRFTGGFNNADGSGLLLSGAFSGTAVETFDARAIAEEQRLDTLTALRLQRGDGIDSGAPFYASGRFDRDIVENDILAPGVPFDASDSINYGFYGSTFDVLNRTVMNLYGIPILSGNTPIVLNGETAPYDLDFILQQRLKTYGGSVDWAFMPTVDTDHLKVRPVFGGRYFRIDETFRFHGASTLLSYGPADGDAPINAKVFPPGDGVISGTGNNASGAGFIPDTPGEDGDPDFVAPIGPTHLIVRSFLNSHVVSNLAGPEFGFQYELGKGKGFKITGNSRLAAMFNEETIHLSGDNIGNFMGIEVIPDPVTGANIAQRMFDTNTTQGPSQNAFTDQDNTVHLSPLFEQGVTVQLPIFSEVPVLKNVHLLEEANLSLGWTFTWVGEIADPNESVLYQSSPVTDIFPEIDTERGSFYQNTLSVGVNWNF